VILKKVIDLAEDKVITRGDNKQREIKKEITIQTKRLKIIKKEGKMQEKDQSDN
jgi:hypothetical protein